MTGSLAGRLKKDWNPLESRAIDLRWHSPLHVSTAHFRGCTWDWSDEMTIKSFGQLGIALAFVVAASCGGDNESEGGAARAAPALPTRMEPPQVRAPVRAGAPAAWRSAARPRAAAPRRARGEAAWAALAPAGRRPARTAWTTTTTASWMRPIPSAAARTTTTRARLRPAFRATTSTFARIASSTAIPGTKTTAASTTPIVCTGKRRRARLRPRASTATSARSASTSAWATRRTV